MKKLIAFTLAEVLITLSIIGVVAAMTIPTLVAKYQKNLWVNQLKKSYSMTSQALKKMMADEETDSISSTSLMTDMSTLQKYLNVLDLRSHAMVDGIEYYKEAKGDKVIDDETTVYLVKEAQGYNLADGTILYLDWHEPKIYLDVNGNKAPNTIDRDLFIFQYLDSGMLQPYVASHIECHTLTIPNCVGGGKMGQGCTQNVCNANPVEDIDDVGSGAARIMRAGWKMEY